MVGAMDKTIIYDRALSPNAVKRHATVRDDNVYATLSVVVEGTQSVCASEGACNVVFSPSQTAAITSVEPSYGWTSSIITVRGANFADNMTIYIGSRSCNILDLPTSTQATCSVQEGIPLLGNGMVSLFIPDMGYSANQVPFLLSAYMDSVSPVHVSRLGGARISISGK
jgi:hypothetical protein